jgi:hypothetical protein
MPKRPLSLALLAVLVFLTSVGLSIQAVPKVLEVISSQRGPLVPALIVIYIQLLWVLAGIASVGLWMGKTWSRYLLIGVLVALAVMATMGQRTSFGIIATQIVFYGLMVWLMYRPKANAFLAARHLAPSGR